MFKIKYKNSEERTVYLLNGDLHNEDGPAVWFNSIKKYPRWYLNNIEYSYPDWDKLIRYLKQMNSKEQDHV